jgi:phage terminase large subunit-like protein
VSIPAQAECLDPADDPLGRELGEFMDSARRRTKAQWEAIKRRSPLRTWAALYQQRPTPAEGTIWQESWISNFRGTTGEAMHKWVRVLVGVDPAATSKLSSDETGIVVTAMDSDGIAWVVDDRSLRGTPTEWGVAVWHAVFDWGGTGIVVESNQGGDMVLTVLQTSWATAVASYQRLHPGWRAPLAPPVTKVHANRSKRIRAESVSALYETGRVRHAADGTPRLAALEDQMTAWTGVGDSPDRIDALVHALTALFLPEHADAGVGAGRQQQQSRRRAAGRR